MLVSPSAIYYITILWKPLSNNTRECCNCSRMSEFAGNFIKLGFTFYYCGGRTKKIMLKPLSVDQKAPWKQRFRATVIAGAQIASAKPDRSCKPISPKPPLLFEFLFLDISDSGAPLHGTGRSKYILIAVGECFDKCWIIT